MPKTPRARAVPRGVAATAEHTAAAAAAVIATAGEAAAAIVADAAKSAAKVIAAAATDAAAVKEAIGDHDALIELRGDVKNLGTTNADNHKALLAAVGEVKGTVEKQNGRISKLETWKTQQGVLLALLIAAGPAVFWALNHWM